MSNLDMSMMDIRAVAALLVIALILGIILILVLLEKNTGGENGGVGCVSVGVVAVIAFLVFLQINSNRQSAGSGVPTPHRSVGLWLEAINPTNYNRLRIDPTWGWYVGGVDIGSAAERAGIRKGDFLLTADGRWLSQAVPGDPLTAVKAGKPPGTTMIVWGYRDFGSSLQQWTWRVVLP
jgi:hypothetical protein